MITNGTTGDHPREDSPQSDGPGIRDTGITTVMSSSTLEDTGIYIPGMAVDMLVAWRHETHDALDLPGQPHELRVGKDPTRTPSLYGGKKRGKAPKLTKT